LGKGIFLIFGLLVVACRSFGQMEPGMVMSSDTVQIPGMTMQMSSSLSLNLPMNCDGSGTGWQPDNSPMMMYMKMFRNTSIMFHGAIFLRYTWQDPDNSYNRGGEQFDAPNWIMFMLQQKLSSNDLFSFTAMNSLDALTVGGSGYPLLFQTGESYHGEPLVDRQHPHDLFAELAVSYTHSFTKDIDLYGYFGYPGEPALGPTVFMHRLSAINNPDAPLGHHWQDATHITFGVATLGFRYKVMKIEGSVFTGREPDENRYNFDSPSFDSYSYRISLNPDKMFSLQFSQGFIKSPEALDPGINVIRTTASAIHTLVFKHDQFIATTVVWGMNHPSLGNNLNSFLLETNLTLRPVSIYSRYEFVQKDAHELNLGQFGPDHVFNINALTVGLNKVLFTLLKTSLSVGLQGTINFQGKDLRGVYGNNPLAGEIYLKIAPSWK
jgi:hypothetical protein